MKLLLILLSFKLANLPFFAQKYKFTDTAKLRYNLDLNKNVNTLGTNKLTYDIYNDTIFLIGKSKLIKISLSNGKIFSNLNYNLFLIKKIKSNKDVNQIIVNKDGYYLSCYNDLYLLSPNAKILKKYHSPFSITDFSVSKNEIIFTSRNSIFLVDKNKGNIIISAPFDFNDIGYIKTIAGISYEGDNDLKIYEFSDNTNKSFETNSYLPINRLKGFKEPTVAYSDEFFFYIFSYYNRDKVLVVKKGESKIFRIISLASNSCTPYKSSIEKEEGSPNFSVTSANGQYFIVAIVNHTLKVLSFEKPFPK